MKYMLLAYSADGVYTDETKSASLAESIRLCHDLNAKGQYLDASPLQPITTATSVRVRDDKRLITDGPFAETREHLGGYFLIEAADLDEALEIAGRVPGARLGTVEVRPLVELDGMP